jgi:beta-lactamase regulating signal transducer with metallopeptidase domain
MTLPYLARLLCLVLASFFLIYLAAAFFVALYTPRALRTAQRFSARTAARFLLTLRLLPAGLALLGAVGLCVPSYLWFEPEGIEEQVGLACMVMALLGFFVCVHALFRVCRNAFRSLIFTRRCVGSGGEMHAAVVIETSQPFVVLTGLIHPRVVISKSIVNALSEEELRMVLNHENAHRASRDNLKLLCFSIAPGFAALERAWLRYAEFAADEQAVAGDVRQSVALASALVRVARFGQVPHVSPLAISFLGDACDLTARVDRLLAPQSVALCRTGSSQSFGVLVILAACIATIALNSNTFRFVQSMLEQLIR